MTTQLKSGFLLEIEDGVITAVTDASGRDSRIVVGQRVISNGRLRWWPQGHGGTVEGIVEPDTGGRTSDILLVHWDGAKEGTKFKTKFKDLL